MSKAIQYVRRARDSQLDESDLPVTGVEGCGFCVESHPIGTLDDIDNLVDIVRFNPADRATDINDLTVHTNLTHRESPPEEGGFVGSPEEC